MENTSGRNQQKTTIKKLLKEEVQNFRAFKFIILPFFTMDKHDKY